MDETTLIVVLLSGLFLLFLVVLVPVFKVLAGTYPYAYTNARIRAMRRKLVGKEKFEEYLTLPYNEIVYSLEKNFFPGLTKYLAADFSYAAMNTALRSELITTLSKLKKISPQGSQKFLSIMLSRYDIQLIKSLVRSTNVTLHKKQEIYFTTEVFSPEFLAQENHNLEELQNELKGTVYQKIINKHYEELKKKQFASFERDLDILLLKRALHHAKSPAARGYVKRLIDIHNVSLVLKGQDALFTGGYIPKEEVSPKMTLPELANKLKDFGYKVDLKAKEKVERDMYRKLKDFANDLLAKDPLSENTILGYMILKMINVRNVNILLKMKHHDFSEEKISEVLS